MRGLLVIVVFLPETLFELWIGFVFGRLAQSPRDDVVVAAAGLRATAAASAAAHALALGARGGVSGLAIGSTLLSARSSRRFEIAFARARSSRAGGTATAIRARAAIPAFAFGAALAVRIALLGDRLLFLLQRLVEVAERIVEALLASLAALVGGLRATTIARSARTFRTGTARWRTLAVFSGAI